MLNWLRDLSRSRKTATELYGVVVARARDPAFYRDWGVPDTPEGRYEMLTLHLVLVLERLRAEGEAGQRLSRETIEAFVADMDDSMREMGVGDLTVPKKVKNAAAGVYARAEALRSGLAEGAEPGTLEAAIRRFTLGQTHQGGSDPSGVDVARRGEGGQPPSVDDRQVAAMSGYVRRTARDLARVPSADVLLGQLTFGPQISASSGDAR